MQKPPGATNTERPSHRFSLVGSLQKEINLKLKKIISFLGRPGKGRIFYTHFQKGMKTMAKRKKYPRLPNGYGSIKFLGKKRRNPYGVYPPVTEFTLDGVPVTPKAICYVDDWMKGFAVLTAYKAGNYTPGMEQGLDIAQEDHLESLASRILADYNRFKGIEPPEPERTFEDVYNAFFADKFGEGCKLSSSSIRSTQAAFRNCNALHSRDFRSLRSEDLQRVLDSCPLKRASLELILSLFHQMYKYAEGNNWCDKDYSSYVRIKKEDDDEHGVPFTDQELKALWKHSEDETVEALLILSYSGWRITEFKSMAIFLKDGYFQGGVKTKAGKGRIVPIHPAIQPLVERRLKRLGAMLPGSIPSFRISMDKAMDNLGIQGTPKHTPHDCRHTFSRLCEKYGIRDNDRARMLGHAFKDITNKVYGHRELEDLRIEIRKIQAP